MIQKKAGPEAEQSTILMEKCKSLRRLIARIPETSGSSRERQELLDKCDEISRGIAKLDKKTTDS